MKAKNVFCQFLGERDPFFEDQGHLFVPSWRGRKKMVCEYEVFLDGKCLPEMRRLFEGFCNFKTTIRCYRPQLNFKKTNLEKSSNLDNTILNSSYRIIQTLESAATEHPGCLNNVTWIWKSRKFNTGQLLVAGCQNNKKMIFCSSKSKSTKSKSTNCLKHLL